MLSLRRIAKAVSALGVGLLAACDNAPTTVKEYQHNDPWDHVIHANSKGPVLVRVVNNPFSVPDAELEDRISDRFGSAIHERVLRYTTIPNASPMGDVFHVVVIFNPAEEGRERGLCGGNLPTTRPLSPDGRLTVLGLVCVEGETWVQVRGQAPNITAPDGHMWSSLMGQMIRELFGRV